MNWYQLAVSEILRKIQSHERGLTDTEAQKRLSLYGTNSLPTAKTKGYIRIFLEQFESPIIYILLIASIIVYFMGELVDASVIMAVLIVNAVIGTLQEGKSQNILNALRSFVQTSATLVRDGKEVLIPDTHITPGDILILKEGDKIPADARIIQSSALKIDESSLTGESEAILKQTEPIETKDLAITEQTNMVYRGTYVVGGSGRAVVISTGIKTYIGGLSSQLVGLDTDIPLKRSVKDLSHFIIGLVLFICVVLFAVGIWQGISGREMFATVIAVSVSAIPEGLPVVVTLILATGVYRMSRRNALVKKLQAVEALGQADVIAVDKTGTLTLNQMMVAECYVGGRSYEVSGFGYSPEGVLSEEGETVVSYSEDLLLAGRIASLNTAATVAFSEEQKQWLRISGDPTECAILVFSQKLKYNRDVLLAQNPQLLDIPFNSSAMYRASVHVINGTPTLSVIGAPEVVLEKCTSVWKDGKQQEIDENERARWKGVIHRSAQRGLRIVALAAKFGSKESDITELPDLCFVGLAGIHDSLRPDVKESVKEARKSGVRVVMITGDHAETAKAIATEAHIYQEGDIVLTGPELLHTPTQKLVEMLAKVAVFARVTPEMKLRIIDLYRQNKNTVAMTGDGVNDALSLAAADLGMAMGKNGTEVAKKAADIVLLDDNIKSIVAAIEEGRNIYRSIQKVIVYLFSTSLGEVLTITAALLFSLPLPITPSQIIWLNFVTDGFLVVALAMEPREYLRRMRTVKKKLVEPSMIRRMAIIGIVMLTGTIFLFSQYIESDYQKATTVALTVLAVFQWFNVWNCRSDIRSIFNKNIFSNLYLVGALGIVIALQFAAVYTPFFQKVLHTVSLTVNDWIVIIAVASSVIVVEEVRKLYCRWRMT